MAIKILIISNMGKILYEYSKKLIKQKVADYKLITNNNAVDVIVWGATIAASSTASSERMYQEYIKHLNVWYFLLSLTVTAEDYELSEEIRKIIEREGEDFHAIINTYCLWYIKDVDEDLIQTVTNEFRKIYGV